ncbi:hypothetical protein KPATCC21470_6799 [Kitasatospora purpeofusca]
MPGPGVRRAAFVSPAGPGFRPADYDTHPRARPLPPAVALTTGG